MGPIRLIVIIALVGLWPLSSSAQIKIGGNVYGGGNHAEVKGSTKVTVTGGDIGAVLDPEATRPVVDPHGRVFGGARMANVGGSTFVHVDGEHATDYILVNQVYGGNDIAGQIGTAQAVSETIPTELTAVKRTEADKTDPKKNAVDDTFNSYVRVSTKVGSSNVYYTQSEIDAATPKDAAYGKTTNHVKTPAVPADDAKKIYIGQLFAGGNGDFIYTDANGNALRDGDDYVIKQVMKQNGQEVQTIIGRSKTPFVQPELDKTYLEVLGGSIVYGYGGGNNATVKKQNIIHIDNPSEVVNHILVNSAGVEGDDETYGTYESNETNGLENPVPDGYTDLLNTARFKEMGINTTFSQPSSGEYQVGRFFGGNNKAEMSIRPTWNLLDGLVRNLYSGGNKGSMTSKDGLLLEIPTYSTLEVDNLFGGCRMADVMPTVNGVYTPCTNLEGYNFPPELSARTLVRGGHINNVYGGNDVTGTVYGGNAIGIYTTVYGDVYGGGNGNYPYTDHPNLEDNDTFGDFWYDVPAGMTSGIALNAFRPNAEQVSIRLKGTGGGPSGYTVIQGSVFLGGNCASLATKKPNPMVELKIGSYVIADNVFLGNNGAGMVDENNLKYYAGYVDTDGNYSATSGTKFNSMDLKGDASVFKRYMTGVAMPLLPSIVFDKVANGDPENYVPGSSFIGSLYCGGNVGSMTVEGLERFTINEKVNIYEKFVGGCNNADVKEGTYNAAYQGGVIGTEDEQAEGGYMENGKIKDRIEINLEKMTITPLRWNDTKTMLSWNTNKWDDNAYFEIEAGTELVKDEKYYTKSEDVYTEHTVTNESITVGENDEFYSKGGFVEVARNPSDHDIRLLGGNVYGGCYESGHVNGNVVININEDVLNKESVFGTKEGVMMGNPASGVEVKDQRDDLMAVSLSVFGAGYGEDTEIWGSTTVNHNNGYAFQIFGGGQQGVVGKKVKVGSGEEKYEFDKAYSSTVNLKGDETADDDDSPVANLAETEYIYGGGNEGDVCGNTYVNLGNGRIYDAFGGACDADILGHTEVYIGRQPNGSGGYKDGFPWIRDIVYGGNDFGGTIWGEYEDGYNYIARLRNAAEISQLHGYTSGTPDVLKSSTYVEYLIGHVDSIFGGGYGSYDYNDTELYGVGTAMPGQHSSFVNIRPKDHAKNALKAVFGGGTGYPGNRDDDKAQDRSYVLIDIPDGKETFKDMEAFGAGSYNGLGMRYHLDTESGKTLDEDDNPISNLDEASAIVDLLHGRIHNAFGGSYQEGVTRRTVVNVPAESTIQIDSIYGGAYGKYILPPCDVYETQVNYKNTSENAQVFGAIFGGNNNQRRSLFTKVNISSPVYSNKAKGYTGTVYGAGRGVNTWAEHTEVNLLKGANVYDVYGGGEMGHVLSAESVQKYMETFKDSPSAAILAEDPTWSKASPEDWHKAWKAAWTLGSYYVPGASNDETPSTAFKNYATNKATNLDRISKREELDDNTAAQLAGKDVKKFNANVIVNEGATVSGYAYGGGLGSSSVASSGDVWGRTYVAVLGGEVKKDVYGGGRAGSVCNQFSIDGFTASANAYVQGGTARNVYGGGYEGHVGSHAGAISASYAADLLANANVAIGKSGTNTFVGGAPAITRNVYGGGEGGSVYGTSHVSLNNGYIGYRYTDKKYVEELDDQKPGDLDLSGNVFGGGYVINRYVDDTVIDMFGGQVRGSLYGGGELGPIGRGANKTGLKISGTLENGDATIFRAGTTQVNLYKGKVLRNVFGGGRGKDSWGGDGTLYMDASLVESLKADGLFCKGYVFGQTRVNIYGGEVGTDEGMLKGYGNVFGGGDEGSVYSAYMKNNKLYIGSKIGKRYDGAHEGYYFQWGPSDAPAYLVESGSDKNIFTEDCKVLVEPHAQAYVAINIPSGKGGTGGDGKYKKGEFVTTADLNLLKDKTTDAAYWDNLDPEGIIIHNAVFAGGNIAAGSNTLYANATTVYGNATASIHDVYNRDLITIGTGHTGGLYGDGNLTFVDGYRELNITNYGTDYYHINHDLSYDLYKDLPEREKAYYELKYKCKRACTDIESTNYSVGSELPQDELLVLFTAADGKSLLVGSDSIIITEKGKKVPNPAIWEQNGVVSVYAGRIMNTIQRADFCGVFGSRMVMKGAQDRVPEIADYSNYTINRVREVSLNKKVSVAGDTDDNALHGNYFGIYSNVNYLGALTSDVKFSDVRTTKANTNIHQEYKPNKEGETFYEWKEANKGNENRNNGSCHNHLALASGVFLELTTEKSKGVKLDEKDWGLITGVVELDLINVQPGIGGGFVYAKNEHGVPDKGISNATLTDLNEGAASKWNYTYDGKYNNWEEDEEDKEEWQTSGNFIHSSQTIIDDCYNVGNRYKGKYGNKDHGGTSEGVPAHYWYISGKVYVYDQYISAYTGSPNAFSESVELPITLNASSNGKMTLMDIRPNLYAYYASYTDETTNVKLGDQQKMVIDNVSYLLNDPISYWDWNKLTPSEKRRFVSETYILKDSCYINSKYYPAGYVMLPSEYSSLKTHAVDKEIDKVTVKAVKKATKDAEGNAVVEKDNYGQDVYVAFDDAFRSSNNMSHNNGYLLTFDLTNPGVWDEWYTKISSATGEKTQTVPDGESSLYEDAPTYRPKTTGVYGQQPYSVNAIIPEKIYTDYTKLDSNTPTENQATFVPAYLITKEYNSSGSHYYPGAPVASAISGYTAPAYVATSTIQLSPTEYIYVNDLMTADQMADYKKDYPSLATEIDKCVKPAYICTVAGDYGGQNYTAGHNYRALEAYSAMSAKDRQNFEFNYDALDLLIDSLYGKKADGTQQAQGKKYQYDNLPYDFDVSTASQETKDNMIYSLPKPIDYTATYHGESALTYTDASENSHTIAVNTELQREAYESIPNEQRHYAPITVMKSTTATTVYVVKSEFVHVETPYAVGATLDSDAFNNLTTEEKKNITTLTFPANSTSDQTYYYCREEYEIGEKGEGVIPTTVSIEGSSGGIEDRNGSNWVKVGTIINAKNDDSNNGYEALVNKQKNFTIHGVSPMETSTLFVARNSNIYDLSKEKIITVVYKYDYERPDADGLHITPVSERHVVNVHVTFKSGVPEIEDINPPSTVLPGTSITMRTPTVTPGAYDITGGGWELFASKPDAESRTNGMAYTPNVDSLYWYQDGFFLAYYARSYLGKTYSNYVPVSVANYHDLKKVMDDKKYHLHVDYDRNRLKRESKIYINKYSGDKDGLDLFKDFYDLSVLTIPSTDDKTGLINSGSFIGHKPLNADVTNGVTAGQNLEFFLRTDIDHTGSWTPIASGSDPCFNGTLHGDGHTISNLTPADGTTGSLFSKLCGSVYNLGVMGSFTGAGVADQGGGYVESCWVKTSGTPGSGVKAVFGNPDADKYEQVVNCYYPKSNSGYTAGKATMKPDRAFYNGEVAYDLNNFYLYKRYSDKMVTNGSGKVGYRYYTIGENDSLKLQPMKYYGENPAYCSSGYIDAQNIGIAYVEDRFDDGDFRYAAGELPTEENERLWIDKEHDNERHYLPIWPDDYIFFGQKLTYGYNTAHQDVPTAVVREAGRLSYDVNANRVYRAPAYFRSKDMGVVHFNPTVYLAQKSSDGTKEAYPGMTAIDFAGHYYGDYEPYGTYGLGNEKGLFYTPVLDDDGLTSIQNCDETQNLLVYAPAASSTSGYANAKTHGVLTEYFVDPQYSTYYDNSLGYRRVDDASAVSVNGHLVQSTLKATNDHLLVDKQDFNCPIAYSFDSSHRMWYQRRPTDNEFVDHNQGWQGISLPFTAELVTTNDKGEITHFYSGSQNAYNDETGTKKIGHEYWLRNLKSLAQDGDVVRGTFNYPDAVSGNKEYTNTFLWDYYYKYADRKDKNADDYQKYYSKAHTHHDYPLLANGTPYIIGLPGKTYYEFDLSGKFVAENTATTITKLGKQTITFASNAGSAIGVSDTEMKPVSEAINSNKYTFRPSYMNETIAAGSNAYTLNSTGNAYNKVPTTGDATVAWAFRPYFTVTGVSESRPATRSIVFADDSDELEMPHESPDSQDSYGALTVTSGRHKIIASSTMTHPVTLYVINSGGITLSSFDVKPGETVETTVKLSGVYIVESADGRFIKKLAVR